jgi:hypothetical protein
MGGVIMTLNRLITGMVLILSVGCVGFSAYHVDAYNKTDALIRKAKVTFDNGRDFEWGAMDPNIQKGMWPMTGRLGRRATVEWEDVDHRRHTQQVEIPHGSWNAIKFVIGQDGRVKVETTQQ